MTRLTLTSTTALVVSLTVAPAFAQNAPFPCEIAEGGTVDSPEAFATYLIAQQAIGTELTFDDPALCGPRAARQAKRVAGDVLADLQVPRGNGNGNGNGNADDAALADSADAAPETTEAEQMASDPAAALTEDASVADAAPEPAATDAADPAAEAAADPAATDAADPAAEAAADPATTDAADPAGETAASQSADPAAQAVADPAATDAADSEETDSAVSDLPDDASDPVAEATEAMTADDPIEDPAPVENAAESETIAPETEAPETEAVEDTAEVPTTDGDMTDEDLAAQLETQDAQTDASAETATTAEQNGDGEGRIGEETTADSSVPPVEGTADIEAQTSAESSLPPEPTAEQRAAREERRAARAAARQESAAAQADAAPAETETEELTQENVRQASEDFETGVISNSEDTAQNDDDDGLSNFEKAILLGLGAAAVGSLLNNGDEVVSNSGDRLIVQRDGELRVLKNDDTLLRQPGAQVQTQTFDDGSTLTTITRDNGSVVRTVRSADGTVLRRTLLRADGTEVALIDDLDSASAPVDVSQLPRASTRDPVTLANSDDAALRNALTANLLANTERTYSLEQVRGIQEVRELAPPVELDTVTFATGSAAIQPSQAEELGALGRTIRDIIAENPGAIFLVEGHTDAVGDAAYNLGLSDRRAETVALALTQYFDVPPENLVTQGYGEQYLKIRTPEAERANRRAALRNVTGLLRDS